MAWITRAATNTVADLLRARDGLAASVASLSLSEAQYLPELESGQILAGNAFSEPAGVVRYPRIAVFCTKVVNHQREKFRKFSGTATVIVELTVSEERSDSTDRHLQLYAEAVSDVLERNLGDWGNGLFYGGRYAIEFKGVKKGGKNYVQTARFELEVDSSEPNHTS